MVTAATKGQAAAHPARSEQLRQSGELEQGSATAHQKVGAATLSCETAHHALAVSGLPANEPVKPQFFHVGVDFTVRQYGIGKRKIGLKLPAYVHASLSSNHAAYDSGADTALPMAKASEPLTPLKIQPQASQTGSPEPFQARLSGGDNALKAQPTVMGYELVGKANKNLNALLGKSLAIHIQRSGILKPNGSGNFKGTMLGTPSADLATTEMLGMKLFVYLRAKVDGQVAIRELVDGKLGQVVPLTQYEQRKLMVAKEFSNNFSGAMPLMPGVYQVHALLDDPGIDAKGAGAIVLAEVHCDGDCLYP